MDNDPYAFITGAALLKKSVVSKFRTPHFQWQWLFVFLHSLKNIYKHHGGWNRFFGDGYLLENTAFSALQYFQKNIFETAHDVHVRKTFIGRNGQFERQTTEHVPSLDGARRRKMEWILDCGKTFPCRRLCFHWMHTGDGACIRHPGRKQNDWKAVGRNYSCFAFVWPYRPLSNMILPCSG